MAKPEDRPEQEQDGSQDGAPSVEEERAPEEVDDAPVGSDTMHPADQAEDSAPEPEPGPDPAPDSEPKKKGSGKFAWLLVFLLLFFIGGVAASPYLLPQVTPYLPEEAKAYLKAPEPQGGGAAVADLSARLNQLDAGLKDVRQVAAQAKRLVQENPGDPVPGGPAALGVDPEALADLKSDLEADTASLDTRLSALAGQVEQVANAQAQQADSYARLQDNLAALPEDGSGGVSPAAVAALRGSLEDMAGTQAEKTAEISARLDNLARDIAALEAVEVPEVDLEALESRVESSIETRVSSAADGLRSRLDALEERLDVVSTAAQDAADPDALAAVRETTSEQISDFETRLAALENVRQQATAAMVAGLETARLAQAVSGGRAYAAELKALRQLKSQAGPALPDISDLLTEIAPFAETGIPSGATLAAQLEDRSREVLTAIDTPKNASWWDRILARLRNLVSVRKVGADVSGDAPVDLLARAEAAARDGDWPAVVREVETLPDSAQTSLGSWWDEAQARAKAEQVLANLSARIGVAAAQTDGAANGGSDL